MVILLEAWTQVGQLTATDRSHNTLCTYGQLLEAWIQVGQLTATDRSQNTLCTKGQLMEAWIQSGQLSATDRSQNTLCTYDYNCWRFNKDSCQQLMSMNTLCSHSLL